MPSILKISLESIIEKKNNYDNIPSFNYNVNLFISKILSLNKNEAIKISEYTIEDIAEKITF